MTSHLCFAWRTGSAGPGSSLCRGRCAALRRRAGLPGRAPCSYYLPPRRHWVVVVFSGGLGGLYSRPSPAGLVGAPRRSRGAALPKFHRSACGTAKCVLPNTAYVHAFPLSMHGQPSRGAGSAASFARRHPLHRLVSFPAGLASVQSPEPRRFGGGSAALPGRRLSETSLRPACGAAKCVAP